MKPEDVTDEMISRAVGLWWCVSCGHKVEPEDVTNDERHDERHGGCGQCLDDPDFSTDRNAAIEACIATGLGCALYRADNKQRFLLELKYKRMRIGGGWKNTIAETAQHALQRLIASGWMKTK